MSRLSLDRALALGATVAAVGIAAAADRALSQPPVLPAHPTVTVPPVAFLTAAISDGPSAEILRRGQYLLRAGDCVSCHLRVGGEPLSGGLGLNTPFGVIFSSNITPDPETGIGGWTADQFYSAMHDGHGAQGENLYPAFPYPWFRRMSRADNDALFAYIKTTPAVHYTPPANHLIFPLNFRIFVSVWNLLFLRSETFVPETDKSEALNRGAYLVNGPGHCGGCHTPKNWFGADKNDQAFFGGVLDDWTAPDLTANARVGLGGWSAADIVEYLKTGRNGHAGAGGAMADVITYSTSLMNDADLAAIAVYLKSLAASASPPVDTDPNSAVLSRGAAIYSDACSSCHLQDGVGQPRLFPPLGRNAVVQQTDATGIVRLILGGTRMAATPTRPTPLSMPSFAWKLSDREIADVATYVRNSWGNQASQVPVNEVAALRRRLDLQEPRHTDNSGDQK
jgi:mono/diheme cytochrome c family protein